MKQTITFLTSRAMRLLIVVWIVWLAPLVAAAQQLICERGFGNANNVTLLARGQVAAVTADSCLWYISSAPSTVTTANPLVRSRLVWVGRAQCDTSSFARVRVGYNGLGPAAIVPVRRGNLLVLGMAGQDPTKVDSPRIFLSAFSRRGQLRWTRIYRPRAKDEQSQGLLEAPDRGAYFTHTSSSNGGGFMSRSYLSKVDSLGQLQWQRAYDNNAQHNFTYTRPAYTVRGNLLLAGTVTDSYSYSHGQLLEVNQRGDSITSRLLFNYPSRHAQFTGVHRLQNGGFLVTALLDTANSAFTKVVALARLDANLNVLWTYRYRQLLGQFTELSRGGLELADGSLLDIIAHDDTRIIHLLRLSATGVLLNDYSFLSSHPAAGVSGANESITPLAVDSSFVLGSTSYQVYSMYLDHFRIPGLRRVLAEPPLPAVQVFLATKAPAAFPAPAYPNPATETVTVPLLPGAASARLRLLDLAGRQVLTQPVAAGAATATLSVGAVAASLYLLTLEVPGQPPATQRLAVAH